MKKILVVDDEEDVRLFLQDLLQEKKFEVDTASSGQAALEKIRNQPPDIVLLDIMMPGMNGIVCLEKIKSENPQIKVIMITALKDDTRMAKAKALGAYAYLAKPFTLDDLETELDKLL